MRSDVRGLPSELAIGEQDLARGFVELDAARLRVQTNDPAGYLVLFDLEGREIEGAEITGFDETVVVTQAGGFAHPPFAGTSTVDRTLRCRLRLSPTATAGVYRWPLKISVRQIGRRG